MEKELHELTFEELVKLGIEIELDAVVQGTPLRKRVYEIMALAVNWSDQKKNGQKV